ncbi:hypothetical protein UZ36_05755 [Candidatus Nitromaritima sp. SCGC AAA799-C22]|nr:hypothetical protein UZ36_05755 [Candidatus Nitromaritima sp. SCGC AAA799-C22]
MKSDIHLALIHYPVYNKVGEVVTSSVTTLDVHDISRAATTYALNSFYVVTPLKTQRQLVERLIEHWMTGYGAEYNPTRKEALLATRVTNNLKETVRDITERCGQTPVTVATGAKQFPQSVDFPRMRQEIERGGPILLMFGTGWGLEKSILKEADYVLNPIDGIGGYNHLPVRAAIAIILDRLLSR